MALFERVCELDLEGIVAQQKFGSYVAEREQSTWFKIPNREYSQKDGREELFERERHQAPVAGWHSCDLACASLEGVASMAERRRVDRRMYAIHGRVATRLHRPLLVGAW